MTLAGTAEAFYGGPVSQLGTGNCGLDIADFAMQHGGDPLLWGSGGGPGASREVSAAGV